MQLDNFFNFKRFCLLCKNDMIVGSSTMIAFGSALAAIVLLFALLFPSGAIASNFHPIIYILLLFVGGLWAAGSAFKDLHEKDRSYAFLTLPASNFEKFISKLLLTSIGYVIALSLGYFLVSLIAVGLLKLLYHHHQDVFNPFQIGILRVIRDYLIFQAIFLFGSVYFNKHPIIKSVLAIGCFALLLFFFSFFINASSSTMVGATHVWSWHFTLGHLLGMMFLIAVGPACWILAYRRLVRSEV